MSSFHEEAERHDALIHLLTRIAKGIEHMADVEAQALADLSTAVTNLGDAIAGEIAALQAALAANVPPIDHSPAIETAVTNLNNLTASLKASVPPPVSAPAPTPAPPDDAGLGLVPDLCRCLTLAAGPL